MNDIEALCPWCKKTMTKLSTAWACGNCIQEWTLTTLLELAHLNDAKIHKLEAKIIPDELVERIRRGVAMDEKDAADAWHHVWYSILSDLRAIIGDQ